MALDSSIRKIQMGSSLSHLTTAFLAEWARETIMMRITDGHIDGTASMIFLV